jgi:RimJ/RimL family protein N-acetyltransferase
VIVQGEGIRLRRAQPDDVDFLTELVTHEEVEPFLAAVGPHEREGVLEAIRHSQEMPHEQGWFVVEADVEGRWSAVGALRFRQANRRSRIANLGALAVLPGFQGRGLADSAARLLQRHLLFDLDYHRLQLECYGFNDRAIRHAERVGFVREGVRRKAYRRHGRWVDGVLFGLLREDLDADDAPEALEPR